ERSRVWMAAPVQGAPPEAQMTSDRCRPDDIHLVDAAGLRGTAQYRCHDLDAQRHLLHRPAATRMAWFRGGQLGIERGPWQGAGLGDCGCTLFSRATGLITHGPPPTRRSG